MRAINIQIAAPAGGRQSRTRQIGKLAEALAETLSASQMQRLVLELDGQVADLTWTRATRNELNKILAHDEV